jgi:hypothetical protein
MRIVVFIDSLFPKDSLPGLLIAAKKSHEFIDFTFVSSQPIDDALKCIKFNGRLSFLPHTSRFKIIRGIASSDLVIGMPTSYVLLKILSRIKVLAFLPLYFGPGKVTKAIGFYKHPERGGFPALKMHLKFVFLNNYYLANDPTDAAYCSAAFGYPIHRIITAPLPKSFYMNEQLCSAQGKERPVGILVAPTHRWEDKIPPLTSMLAGLTLQARINDPMVRVYHSKHPDTQDAPLNEAVKIFSGNWDEIDILITDYSSIGDDFLNAGGGLVIYYIADRDEFELHQGKGLFISASISAGRACNNFDELCQTLNDFLSSTDQKITKEFTHPNYYNYLAKKHLKN